MNSLMKTAPLVGSTELSTDDRAHQRLSVMAMGVEDTQLLLYPRLIPLVGNKNTLRLVISHYSFQLLNPLYCFSAQHRRQQREAGHSCALLWGASHRLWHLPAGERPVHVPVAGPSKLTRPHPEPVQPALPRPPARTHGQHSFHHFGLSVLRIHMK